LLLTNANHQQVFTDLLRLCQVAHWQGELISVSTILNGFLLLYRLDLPREI
jgi:hypothetical protein